MLQNILIDNVHASLSAPRDKQPWNDTSKQLAPKLIVDQGEGEGWMFRERGRRDERNRRETPYFVDEDGFDVVCYPVGPIERAKFPRAGRLPEI